MELDGQFEKLDSYLEGPAGTAGWWHASCLADAGVGPGWYEARLRNFRDVRGYRHVGELPRWSVLEAPRGDERLALGQAGELLSLPHAHAVGRAVEGGRVYPVVHALFNLQLDDGHPAIAAIQQALATDGTCPLMRVLALVGVADRVVHPIALEDGLFRFDPDLAAYWTPRAVVARVEYGLFVPDALVAHLG